jgi:hypothetical protein
MYLEQSLWRDGVCHASALYRSAATRNGKMVPIEDVARAVGVDPQGSPVPEWVSAWADADAQRPWPPSAETALAAE